MSQVADPAQPLARVATCRRRTGMLAAVRAEWIKMRTVSGPGWLLLACAVVTITVSSAVVSVEKCSSASCAVETRPGNMHRRQRFGTVNGSMEAVLYVVPLLEGWLSCRSPRARRARDSFL